MFAKALTIFFIACSFGRNIENKEDDDKNNGTTEIIKNMDIKYENLSLAIKFKAFDKSYNIRLTETAFAYDLLYSDGDIMKGEGDFLPIFINEEKEVSILLKGKKEAEGYSIDGTIGDDIIIKAEKCDAKIKHTVTKLQHKDLANDYLIPETVPDDKDENQRHRRSAPSVVRPEVLVVVDSTLYDKLGRDTAATNQYIRNFWSAVNLRFKTISNPRVELNIAGIIISKTPAATPFLKNSKVSSNTFNAATALHLMGKHYYKANSLNLPIFDMVVTLTNLDMCSMKGSSCKKNTAGYAYVGGACVTNKRLQKINSVAIVEDGGGYSGVVVAAHEVAHLLGAVHDGDRAAASVGGPGASSCSKANGFIMSDNRRTEKGLRWSGCTKNQLSHFLCTPSASCLHNTPHNKDHQLQDHAALTRHVLSLDDQCYQEMGTKSCFSDSRVCTQLFCLHPATGACISYRPAVEGSQCGGGKVCKDGLCEEISKTPKEIKNLSKKKTEKPKKKNKIAKPDNSIPDKCEDNKSINVRGITDCTKLFKSFSLTYCNNKYVKKICCSSHAVFCNK